jgi:hypothetical protein
VAFVIQHKLLVPASWAGLDLLWRSLSLFAPSQKWSEGEPKPQTPSPQVL